jgi:predicted RND superfamily exporter protein
MGLARAVHEVNCGSRHAAAHRPPPGIPAFSQRFTAGNREASRGRFQFTVGDLFLTTTGVGLFAALVVSDGETALEDVLVTGCFVLTVIGVSVLLLSLRRIWVAIAICLTVLPVVGYSAMWAMSLTAWPWDLSRAAGACLLIAIGSLRSCGYRVARIA